MNLKNKKIHQGIPSHQLKNVIGIEQEITINIHINVRKVVTIVNLVKKNVIRNLIE